MDLKPKTVPLNLSKLAHCPSEAKPVPAPEGPLGPEEIKERVVVVLRNVFDPEIPVNIYELGLVYDLDVTSEKVVTVRMTLTSPACPVAGSLVGEIQSKVKAIPGVAEAKVELVWDPPWSQERMSDAARLQLGLF